ncbi:hypothetical protein GQ53DRAFT_588173, partial [Thozetella sp. PMI_491]
ISNVAGIILPSVTGPLPVGTVALELVDHSRLDPLAPSPQPRTLMASLFYPTTQKAIDSGIYTLASYMPSLAAAALDEFLGAPAGTAESIVTQSYLDAPIANDNFPVLIFSHAFGASRLLYTAQLQDLASQGWVIVAIDHTYEAFLVEFPDGTLVPSLFPLDADTSIYPGLVEIRVADVNFVAAALKNSTISAQIPGLSSCGHRRELHVHEVGIFGHSLGGNTAAQAMSNYTRFICGANFDGSIYSPVGETGLDKPFLLMAAQDHNRSNDASWAMFWDHLKGFRREFMVNATVHQSFEDLPVLNDLL